MKTTLSYELEYEFIKFWRYHTNVLDFYNMELQNSSIFLNKSQIADSLFENYADIQDSENKELLIKYGTENLPLPFYYFINSIHNFVYEIEFKSINLVISSNILPEIYSSLYKAYKLTQKDKYESRINVCDEIKNKPICEAAEFTQYVYENSNDPIEVKQAYIIECNNSPFSKLNLWQLAALENSFNKQSYIKEFDGGDFLLPFLCKKHLKTKGGETFDVFSQRMEMDHNIFVEPSEVCQFLYDVYAGLKSIRKTTDLQMLLARKYKQITGESINKENKVENKLINSCDF